MSGEIDTTALIM